MDYKRSLVGYNCHNSEQSPTNLRITSEQADANSQAFLSPEIRHAALF